MWSYPTTTAVHSTMSFSKVLEKPHGEAHVAGLGISEMNKVQDKEPLIDILLSSEHLASDLQVRALNAHEDEGALDKEVGVEAADGEGLDVHLDTHGEGTSNSAGLAKGGEGERREAGWEAKMAHGE